MNTTLKIGFVALLATGVLSGCGKSTQLTSTDGSSLSGAAGQDQTEVAGQLAANPEFVEDGVFATSDPTAAGATAGTAASAEFGPGPGPGAPPDSLRPLRFWRRITNVRRGYEFAFSDTDSTGRPTRAVVTVKQLLTGTFDVAFPPPPDSLFVRRVVRKPLEDHWVRRILLDRVQIPNRVRREWRIVGFSGVQVTSQPNTTQIVSLRLQSAGFDSTITDPLAFFHMRGVLRFDPNDSITVTVTTLRNDDVVVVQHRDRHMMFHNNGDNTYTGVFRAGLLMGVRHVGVNALSHGAVFSPDAAYDSQAWILPYVLRAVRLADYEP